MTNVKEDAIPNSLRELIKTVATQHGFDKYSIDINSVSTAGANYMGDLFAIDVKETGKETLHLFAKVSNTPEKARAVVPARKIYEREIFAYTDLAKAFDNLQKKHHIPDEERFKFAKYYGSDLTELQEVLLLENLSKKGYTMYDRKKSMTWEYAKAALDQLGKYHALSFALEIEQPELYDRLIRTKEEFLMNRPKPDKKDGFEDFQTGMLKTALAALDSKYHAVLIEFFEDIEEYWKRQMQPLTQQSVLVHGDYRISNQMVRYEEGALASLLTLDYQTIFHGSPLNDLVYLLITGSDSDFRRLHYNDYVQHYRRCLGSALARLGQDLETIYPRQLFDQHLKDKLLYGLGLAVFLLPIITVEASQAPKIADMVDDTKRHLPGGNSLYSERINGIMEDMVRWGVISLHD